jgi:hypothetical protein
VCIVSIIKMIKTAAATAAGVERDWDKFRIFKNN